ncbi:MAG: PAS domain-containing protein [Steroidobacteraceae bacterium]|nr:PAS domain-containing protein [Deltaproteobacteria bacterium]
MEQNTSIPNYSTFKRAIVSAVSVLILFIIGFSVWKAVVEYRLTIRAAELQSRGYARALKEHADRAFGEADNILLDTLDHIRQHGGINKESSSSLRDFLNRHPRNIPQVGAIFLVNREGLLFGHTLNDDVKQISVADREYFLHHRANPEDDTPFLSRPAKSRVNGKWRFYLSRPVRSASGTFDGLVAVAFEMEYFQEFYASLDLGKKGRIVILRKDGVMLLSQPFKESDFSADFKKSHLFRTYLPKAPGGTFRVASGKALLESQGRIISYESLYSFPIVVNANMGTDDVTAPWRESTYKQGFITLAACLALVVLTVILLRQIKRIEQAYRRQVEQQAEISTAGERYRLLVDNLPVVTWQSDEHGKTQFISRVATKIEGYTPEEIYAGGNALWLDRIHPDDLQMVSEAFRALFADGAVYDIQFRIKHKAGHWIWVHDFAFATSLQNGVKVAHGVFSDVTARKQAEDERDQLEIQLRQAQKMEAIGHLAGGIAHDFNNLLTPIMGYAEMAAASVSDQDPLVPRLAGIIAAAHKAKELTQQLLSFGRRQSIVTEVIDLNEVILSFNDIVRRTIRESIRIDLLLDPEGSYIKADRSQIEQIILNMTVNAQDAFDGTHGRINIETCRVWMDGENARLHPGMLPGEYVLLSFRDNGCGMSADVVNHIFEPFFTTKRVGHGTGLGLATVYGIVKQHDAHIAVVSQEDEGTTFTIYFPCCDQVPLFQPQIAQRDHSRNSGEATILVVEDNEMVREMVREMLEGSGYTILTAADPLAAIELLAGCGTGIDLLVSDVVMPGMNGPELYEQLVVQLPSLKVVYISGYPVNPGLRGVHFEDEVNYLQKPFTAEALLERIRQVL